jgi:hypothetical protein
VTVRNVEIYYMFSRVKFNVKCYHLLHSFVLSFFLIFLSLLAVSFVCILSDSVRFILSVNIHFSFFLSS